MKLITFCGAFFFLSLCIPSWSQSGQSTYCNNRFGFCVQYPESLRPVQDAAINGDGLTLELAGSSITVSVSGSHNAMDWTPEKIYYYAQEELADRGKSAVQKIHEKVNDKGFDALLTSGELYEYTRMWLLDESYLIIIISGKNTDKAMIEQLSREVSVEFQSTAPEK
ncbi:MAG TPA: hypothetical protein PKA00_13085 [Saprospiraceae bacterium]|nr:hypothetical protein [Saprospiraceae bacterium]HMQ83842.1 hypothetical protein [Saprospiraceae bacterium]